MRGRIGLLLMFFVLIACNNGNEKPIAKEDLIDLIKDLHMIDAFTADYAKSAELKNIDSTILYSSVMQKYNTNRAEFEKTIRWYTNHPKELAKIYEEVLNQLNLENEIARRDIEKINSIGTLSLINETENSYYQGDTINYPAPYLIEIEDTGTYLIDISARMRPDDISRDPFLNIYFVKDTMDLNSEDRLQVYSMHIPKSNFARDYQCVFKLVDKNYKYLKIILPDTPDREKNKMKNLQITKVRVRKNKVALATDTPNLKEDE